MTIVESVVVAMLGLLAEPGRCESLTALTLPNTTMTSVRWVAEGPYTPPPVPVGRAAPDQTAAPPILPAHCRVTAVMKPSSDSHIGMELWLPQDWNGKFQMVGNGGWAGIISYPAMVRALLEGYATASTDAGHRQEGPSALGGSATFAIGHREKLIDLAYRSVHETAVQAKAIIASYYRSAARLSYWNGCSTGGRQGLILAQKYPDDFDAILAGAPANSWSEMHAWDLASSVPPTIDPAQRVPATKLALVRDTVLEACDAKDGVKDGLLNEPRACTFDIATLQCSGGDSESCLTAPQVMAIRRLRAPARTASGQLVFVGLNPGTETGWALRLNGQPVGVAVGSFQVAHDDANWDPRTFDLDRDLKIVNEKVGSLLNATNPDLSRFKARGGKLLLFHGWSDPLIPAGNTINYYDSVLAKMGQDQADWLRLFMVPGMGHCQGGEGPSQVNWMAALERWRESGRAPDRIDAARVAANRLEMTRPLCPYPQVADYIGVGSTNDAGSFVCKVKD